MYNCGQSAWKGSWAYCDERGVERRWDGNRLYTALEFKNYYGKDGQAKWTKGAVEKRRASNGVDYTLHEFRDFYIDGEGERGWVEKWVAAGSSQTSRHYSSEKRQANDGQWYTWDEFERYYGADARSRWNVAKRGYGEF